MQIMPSLKRTMVIFLLSSLGMASCDVTKTSKVADGIASEDQGLISRYEKDLSEAGIPYTINAGVDGKTKIMWDSTYSKDAEAVKNSIRGILPDNTSGLCSSNENSLTDLLVRLRNNNVSVAITNPYSGDKCAYWDKRYDEKVSTLDVNWNEIQDQGQ
jgi:hypothetical protein